MMRYVSLLAATVFFSLFFAPALLPTGVAAQEETRTIPGNEIARINVRFSELEEHLRRMQGKLEEVEFENRRLRERLDLFQQDAELRFSDLEEKTRGGQPVDTSADTANNSDSAPTAPSAVVPAATESQTLKIRSGDSTNFETSRDHYNHAFRLLNQTQYAEAGESFEEFIERYPKDPLIGNAFYWAGESYYVRQDYVRAADYFRRGYEVMSDGPKAGDNLLKMAMSLAALKRNTEACVVLKQVTSRFGNNSTSLKNKAETERNRLGCK